MKSGPLQSKAAIVAMVVSGILVWFVMPVMIPTAQAQGGPSELPPFPILYGGRALVDGEALPAGTRLTARVGGYETGTVVEEDGYYRNLLLAPPSGEYYSQPVTFHALNMTAAENDVFVQTAAPVFKDVGFDIHFTRAEPEEPPAQVGGGGEPNILVWGFFAGTFLFLAGLIGWFVVRKQHAT